MTSPSLPLDMRQGDADPNQHLLASIGYPSDWMQYVSLSHTGICINPSDPSPILFLTFILRILTSIHSPHVSQSSTTATSSGKIQYYDFISIHCDVQSSMSPIALLKTSKSVHRGILVKYMKWPALHLTPSSPSQCHIHTITSCPKQGDITVTGCTPCTFRSKLTQPLASIWTWFGCIWTDLLITHVPYRQSNQQLILFSSLGLVLCICCKTAFCADSPT